MLRALAVLAVGATFSVALSAATIAAEPAKLVKYEIKDGNSIPKSLTGKPGDAKKGREAAIHRKKGNCLACHTLPIPEQSFHGDVGPDLKGVADRYSEGEIRLRLVNSKVVNEDTIMPAFYKTDGLNRVMKKFKGKTILSAQDVEDIVAYLMTLK
ncbi:MAG: sulfur oxidation c-type cytochrome SoxX [Rhodospirillales bacterium]|nr:sulfur oxidation c-type cytochrome SoxX [Rhodospirillales bacterium]